MSVLRAFHEREAPPQYFNGIIEYHVIIVHLEEFEFKDILLTLPNILQAPPTFSVTHSVTEF